MLLWAFVYKYLLSTCFQFFEYIPGNGTAGLYGILCLTWSHCFFKETFNPSSYFRPILSPPKILLTVLGVFSKSLRVSVIYFRLVLFSKMLSQYFNFSCWLDLNWFPASKLLLLFSLPHSPCPSSLCLHSIKLLSF